MDDIDEIFEHLSGQNVNKRVIDHLRTLLKRGAEFENWWQKMQGSGRVKGNSNGLTWMECAKCNFPRIFDVSRDDPGYQRKTVYIMEGRNDARIALKECDECKNSESENGAVNSESGDENDNENASGMQPV